MAIISEKTKKFISGRCGQMKRIEAACRGVENIIWVHSASYGEFEEARPVISGLKRLTPGIKILATFFSPSGYEYLKDDPIADFVFYLPLDTPGNARRFLDAVRPVKVIISISDFWLCFLNELRRRSIPTYLISACFNAGQFYFKPFGFPYRNAFRNCFKKIVVRDEASLNLLKGIGADNGVVVGDPRMDRVVEIASEPWSDPVIDRWAKGAARVFVAGSVLPDEDEVVISDLANSHPGDKFLIVPHEISDKEVESISEKIKGRCEVYSRLTEGYEDAQVLIINTVGMLAKVYRYGFAAYVGSGFDCSPHSIIEPAAYGIPVSYGPEFGSYCHCQGLIDAGGGCSIHNSAELAKWYDKLVADEALLAAVGEASRRYCATGSGVSEAIAREIL